MGWGGGGRGRRAGGGHGAGHGGGGGHHEGGGWRGGMSYYHHQAQQQYQYESWGEEDVEMEAHPATHWGGQHAAAAAVDGFAAGGQPSLAAQWRFASRSLRRHAPEERVYDPRHEIRAGDHVYVSYGFAWDLMEHHGIVCGNEDNHHGQRRGASSREESQWVIHWKGNSLTRSPLSQFAKGGQLYRVPYPCWAAQAYLPAGSCGKPHVADQRYLEVESDETVVKQVTNAYWNGSWEPTWSQARDLEFCLAMKTGGKNLPWEVHTAKTLATTIVVPIGFLVRGECRPTQLLNGGATSAGAIAAAAAGASGNPGYNSRQGGSQRMLSVAALEAYQFDRYGSGSPGGNGSDGAGRASSSAAATNGYGPPDGHRKGGSSAVPIPPPWAAGCGCGGDYGHGRANGSCMGHGGGASTMYNGFGSRGCGGAEASTKLSADAQEFIPGATLVGPPTVMNGDGGAPPSWDGVYQ